MKTKEEFWVEEAEFTGGHPENVKFEESSFNKFGEHGSDFTEVEKFATGKNTIKSQFGSREQHLKKTQDKSHWVDDRAPEADDYASGGRVPLGGGGRPKGSLGKSTKMSDKQQSDLLDISWDDMDPDEWIHLIKLARAGEFGAAEGGRVPMWLGGGLLAGKSFLKELLKKLGKDRGMSGSKIMKVMNPKAYKKFLDDPAIAQKWHPESGLLATDKAKQLMKGKKEARADQLERYLDMAKSSMESDKNVQSMIDAGIKSGFSRTEAEELSKGLRKAIDVQDIIPRGVTDETILDLEQMLKNLRTKDQKLHATGGRVSLSSGGVAGMLGE